VVSEAAARRGAGIARELLDDRGEGDEERRDSAVVM
jgi:hypothetical protein